MIVGYPGNLFLFIQLSYGCYDCWISYPNNHPFPSRFHANDTILGYSAISERKMLQSSCAHRFVSAASIFRFLSFVFRLFSLILFSLIFCFLSLALLFTLYLLPFYFCLLIICLFSLPIAFLYCSFFCPFLSLPLCISITTDIRADRNSTLWYHTQNI